MVRDYHESTILKISPDLTSVPSSPVLSVNPSPTSPRGFRNNHVGRVGDPGPSWARKKRTDVFLYLIEDDNATNSVEPEQLLSQDGQEKKWMPFFR